MTRQDLCAAKEQGVKLMIAHPLQFEASNLRAIKMAAVGGHWATTIHVDQPFDEDAA